MNRTLKTVLKTISTLLTCAVVALAILLAGVKLLGVEIYTVLSPSMEPDYPTGSLIYVKDVDPAELKVNEVITYRLTDSMTATHRIIELVPDEKNPSVIRFRTKGDNNDDPDGALVELDQVIGKPVFCIPLLGYLALYIQTRSGTVVAGCVGAAIIILTILIDIITDDKNKKNKNREKGKGEETNEKT